MTTTETVGPGRGATLRLWPGVAAATLLVLTRWVVAPLLPDGAIVGVLGSVACAAIVLLWWLLFSRAAWIDRIGAVVAAVLAVVVARPLMHASIIGGMMGMMYPLYAVPPVAATAFVIWAVATRHRSAAFRRVTMVATLLLACSVWALFRTDGVMGSAGAQITWRWKPTYEQRLLAQTDEPPAVTPSAAGSAPAPAPAPATATASPAAADPPALTTPAPRVVPAALMKPADWPGFRGPRRDGVVRGVEIATDWSASPPAPLWHRAVGPGWSSFAVRGDRLFTQEQRGEDELVSCYRVSTGQPVWRHRDRVRFWESNGGAGPRGTPTLSEGRVFAFGATGVLNALDETTGTVLWSRNVAADTKLKVPMWGFSSSPVVLNGMVVVAASGKLAAYDAASGDPRWISPTSGASYSSPQLATLDGVPQILILGAQGAQGIAPATGARLWEAAWPGSVTIVQPAVIDATDVLITTSSAAGGDGVRRLGVSHGKTGWTAEERWTSNGLKPYFNDYVIANGYAFGFDGNILSCIDLADGKRKWKGGRYGNGQLVLLPEQALLLVISEEGDLVLVKATPDQFTEVARFPGALEGKTWNHPVLVRDVLLVRNDHEMAAYRLPPGIK